MAILGEQFDHSDEITGIVVSIRKMQNRICIWTRGSSDKAVLTSIGLKFKSVCGFKDSVGFASHDDAANRKGR